MNWRQGFNRFDLDDEPATNQKVDFSDANDHVLVTDLNALLPREFNSSVRKLDHQRTFIYFLWETWAKLTMNLNCSSDDLARQRIEFRRWFIQSYIRRNLIILFHALLTPELMGLKIK